MEEGSYSLIFEKIKGKHLNEKFEVISNFIGFGLLMALVDNCCYI